MRNLFNRSVFALAITGIVLTGAFGQGPRTQMNVEEANGTKKLNSIKNDESSFRIRLAINHADRTYKIGDTMVINLTATKDCYVTLFNVDAAGKTTILFPNQYHKENFLAAGEEVRIPQQDANFIFRAAGPAGTELLKAIATVKAVDLVSQSDTRPTGAFLRVVRPQSFIATTIEKELDDVEKSHWAEAGMSVKVVE